VPNVIIKLEHPRTSSKSFVFHLWLARILKVETESILLGIGASINARNRVVLNSTKDLPPLTTETGI
jgi:hypothetical protein